MDNAILSESRLAGFISGVTFFTVRRDLGTDSGPHPVHCRLDQYGSITVSWHRANNGGN